MTVMRNHKKLFIVISIILSLIVALVASFFLFLQIGKSRLLKNREYDVLVLPDAEEDGEYVYNQNVINILLIGVDKKSNTKDPTLTEQADALYLFALDIEKKLIRVISISRNTLMKIDVYDDIEHRLIGTANKQVCTSYAFGRTREESAELTVKAVSRFFYNIPISGYYAIYTDAVGEIVDSVGGVPLQVPEDMTSVSSTWKQGANIVLTGKDALTYLRYRGESNEPRLERQKGFLQEFLTLAKQATGRDLTLPLQIYQKVAARTVTNVDAASVTYFASEAVNAEFSMVGLKGTVGSDGIYETFTVDQNDLHELLTDVFYKKQ